MGLNFWPFRVQKDDNDALKEDVRKSFHAVKTDINKAAEWISHLHTKNNHHETKFEVLDSRLSTIEKDLDEIKNFISFFSTRVNGRVFKQLSKQDQTADYKQTAVGGVQTPVQTGVQTAIQSGFMGHLSVMERAIVWVLINTDMKLSCEDISAILNKERSTVRGQLNSIKQKSEGLISEVSENSGKKRFFVDEKVKEMLLSRVSESKHQSGLKAKGKGRK
jgi:predicted transcriptional regulator